MPTARALVTGYDFLTDQANAIASHAQTVRLQSQRHAWHEHETLNTLIGDTWNVNDLTNDLVQRPAAAA